MKKYNVFKVLLLALFGAIIVSFILPKSQIGYTGIEKGVINPITFVDTISNGLTSFSVFIANFILILSIGIFYSVLKKTEKYDAIINNTACKFKNNKKAFIILTVVIFGFLAAAIGEVYAVLFMIPAFIDTSKKLGFDSKTSILITVGSTLLGLSSSLYTNYTNQILALKVSTNILVKVITLVVSLLVLVLFAIFKSKPEDVKLEKEKTKKTLPISIIFDVMIVLTILGMVSWKSYFNFNGFSDLHNSIIEFKLFKVSVFNAIVGTTITAFGEWSIYSLVVLMIVMSIIISIIYKLKIDGLFEAVSNGIKKALPYGLILIIANAILVGVYNSGFFVTAIKSIGSMKDSILSTLTISSLSSLVYPDYTYASQFTLSTIATIISKKAIFASIGLIFQLVYSLMLLISPTSIVLLMALRYEDVRYKDWIKYIYKFLLGLLIIFFITIIIVSSSYIRPISYVVLAVLIVIFVLLFILGLGKKKNTKQAK